MASRHDCNFSRRPPQTGVPRRRGAGTGLREGQQTALINKRAQANGSAAVRGPRATRFNSLARRRKKIARYDARSLYESHPSISSCLFSPLSLFGARRMDRQSGRKWTAGVVNPCRRIFQASPARSWTALGAGDSGWVGKLPVTCERAR
ncbi:hypothetical protein PVAP13_1KG111203 [Panicum virgatum]|uniref:Uncharacterized protein n=1 Tax=Panicum virgatum TaxID=38727 RepID=A0A8T0XQ93_PANVG|nr:hypothetical protein PVAP13_1KG111203 [Panicum virgatum]